MSKVIEINKSNFENEVIKSSLPVLVDFYAPWCGPCRMMSPILDELSEELVDKIKIVKLNTDEEANQELAGQYNIKSIPNMKIFKDGKVVENFLGYKEKETFKKEILNVI